MFEVTGLPGVGLISLESAVIRAALEGVPIAALKRIFRPGDSVDIRDILAVAKASGVILDLPSEDWPPFLPIDKRGPMVPRRTVAIDDGELVFQLVKLFKTTRLESKILLTFMRRGHVNRAQLHDIVESNRGNPDEATDEKIIDVIICKLRKKLTLKEIKLTTVHSIGYEMGEADRKKCWEYLNVSE